MPKELKRLLICQILGWMANFSISLFFTDFVAQVIYKNSFYYKKRSNPGIFLLI